MASAGHWIQYGLFSALESAVSTLSWPQRVALGTRFGRLWRLLDSHHRSIARQNVANAYPEWPNDRRVALVRSNFEHLGATAAEFFGLTRTSPLCLLERYRFEGLEHLEGALAVGKGVLVLTAHLGNWELASVAFAAKGYAPRAIARTLSNPLINRRIASLRGRFGAELIPHRRAARPVLRALADGRIVGLLLDQRALLSEAVRSQFFGQPVATNQGLAVLALRSGAPVVPGFDERVGEDHVLRFEPPLSPPAVGSRQDQVRRFTQLFDQTVEAAVRRRPEQWFWVHRRWRVPPELKA